LPVSTLALAQNVLNERVSTGVADLDSMLGGQGFYRGSSILISGTAGSGKTSLAAHFAAETCKGGRRCIYFAFEESPFQIIRNMRSIGLDLKPLEDMGVLRFIASRPTSYGLELHLAKMCKAVQEFAPDSVVVDPISNLMNAGTDWDARLMLMRLVDFLKSRKITTLMTSLTRSASPDIDGEYGISSMVDTWLLVRELESDGARSRSFTIIKSRGMSHSNLVREFRFSHNGIRIADPQVSPERFPDPSPISGTDDDPRTAQDNSPTTHRRKAKTP
jgi:circadian clock protein KaiC